MEITKFEITGPLLIKLKKFSDNRGFFVERFRSDLFKEIGLTMGFCQENFSRSHPQVLRGLHYQYKKPQGKLITVTRGTIFDVAVDVRKESPTFGKHIAIELSGDEPTWFWIPSGFAHGFCALGSQEADLLYKVDNYYDPKGETGIHWNDIELQIAWPIKAPLVNEKDQLLPRLSNQQLLL